MTKKTDKKETGKKIDPLQYFENLKNVKKKTDDKFLKDLYTTGETLLQKAFAVGQESAIRKLIFAIDVLEKEKKLLDMGFDTFVYRDDVEYFISDVEDKVVKIIELEKYPREIPDEVAEQIVKLKEQKLFDKYFIVFTDYTGEAEREVKEERKRKDPILFGCFIKDTNVHDRFYYIADWEDEYCDLTLSKMVTHMAQQGKKIDHPVGIKKVTIEEVKDYMSKLTEDRRNRSNLSYVIVDKPSLLSRVKLWFKKK